MNVRLLTEFLIDLHGSDLRVKDIINLSGGCINNAFRVDTSCGTFFVKYNQSNEIRMFESEKKGLELLRKFGTIKTPEVIGSGQKENYIFLVLEFIESAKPDVDFWGSFGRSLANLHKVSASVYGLEFDNYIGSLAQINTYSSSWVTFFIENRLRVQLELAFNTGKVSLQLVNKMEELFLKLPDILIEDKPSLLHGDLWSGNVIINADGRVALIDPAVYFGNREAELAFTSLFGGFENDFYRQYDDEYPLEKGFENRVDLYNLYPLLVHVNLFAGGYLNSVNRILENYS